MTTADPCLICKALGRHHAATPGYRTCDLCATQIRDDLAEIRDRWWQLDVDVQMIDDNAGGGHSVPGSRAPGSDHVIAIKDHRSTWNGTVYSPAAVLPEWAGLLASETGRVPYDGTVPGLVSYLTGLHAHSTRQPWSDDYATELHELVAALRPATGVPRGRSIGRCPNQLDDDTECGTQLWLPPMDDHGRYKSDTITCHECRTTWPRPRWELLARAQRTQPVRTLAVTA